MALMGAEMTDMSASLSAIREFFIVQDRCRTEQVDALCDHFLSEVTKLQNTIASQSDSNPDVLADSWPLLELRDAMTLATREVVNLDGSPTLLLRKRNSVRGNPYGRLVTLVDLSALEEAIKQTGRLAARLPVA